MDKEPVKPSWQSQRRRMIKMANMIEQRVRQVPPETLVVMYLKDIQLRKPRRWKD